jgi:hypothetical protein
VSDLRASGLPVRYTVDGATSGLALTVYRVVQESLKLTNTLKHAGPATPTAAVVRQRPDAVQVRVAYEGPSAEAGPDQVRSRELPTAAADPAGRPGLCGAAHRPGQGRGHRARPGRHPARGAVELTAQSALALVDAIRAALAAVPPELTTERPTAAR